MALLFLLVVVAALFLLGEAAYRVVRLRRGFGWAELGRAAGFAVLAAGGLGGLYYIFIY